MMVSDSRRVLTFRKIKGFYQKNSWGILLFFILLMEFIFNKSENLKPWGSCWYGVDYSMGIGSRFLIGTILHIITGGRVSTGKAYFFCEIALIVLIAMVAFLANIVVRKADRSELEAVVFLILCFISSPGSIASMWTDGNMGRMETYTLLISLVSVVLFHQMENVVLKYSAITVLSIISIAIYQGYVFLYFPIIFVLMLGDILKDRKIRKFKVFCGIGSCLFCGLAFCGFQFFSYVKFDSAKEMADFIRQKTDLNVKEEAIYYEFFASISEAYHDLNIPFLHGQEFPREKTLLLLVVLLPLIIVMTALYSWCLKEVKCKYGKNGICRRPYIYCILINLVVLPQFLLNVDWGRWMIAITINLFFEVLYLFYMGFEEMVSAIRRLNAFVEKNKALAVMCVLYLTIFNKFEDRSYFAQLERLWSNISNI